MTRRVRWQRRCESHQDKRRGATQDQGQASRSVVHDHIRHINRFEIGTRAAPGIRPRPSAGTVLLDDPLRQPTGCRGEGRKPIWNINGVTEHRRRGFLRVGYRRDIVGVPHEAIVHIAGADNVLSDLVRFRDPIWQRPSPPLAGHLGRSAAHILPRRIR